ncbi:MAG TPA: hypothetical protein VLG37_02560 [Candidatus Saccharimonadales bacterium]|nr:hypothetical protein [Candidatus Saccharimonadales bacterium]
MSELLVAAGGGDLSPRIIQAKAIGVYLSALCLSRFIDEPGHPKEETVDLLGQRKSEVDAALGNSDPEPDFDPAGSLFRDKILEVKNSYEKERRLWVNTLWETFPFVEPTLSILRPPTKAEDLHRRLLAQALIDAVWGIVRGAEVADNNVRPLVGEVSEFRLPKGSKINPHPKRIVKQSLERGFRIELRRTRAVVIRHGVEASQRQPFYDGIRRIMDAYWGAAGRKNEQYRIMEDQAILEGVRF